MKQVFLGSIPYEHMNEGGGHIKPGSKIHLELNEKSTSVRVWVEDDHSVPWVTVVPFSNIACLVYAEVSLRDGLK